MKKLLAAIGVVVLTITVTACAPEPEPDTRIERVATYLHATESMDSKLIADNAADAGVYEQIATDLVELCDEGSSSGGMGYASAFNETDASLAAAIVDAWEIACPE